MEISQKKFNKILKKNFLFEKKPTIAVAVSGGPDSMALVFLLNKWIQNNQGKIFALIIDHGIRKESYKESKTIKEYLCSKNIESHIFRVNKKKIIKNTMKEARVNRYEKLIKFCVKKNIFHLFLGHHYDDNIETFILRKIAGSNLQGLRAMQYNFLNDDVKILRPLIDFNKKEILKYNNQNKIFYLVDPSNKNLKYSRVAVRKFLVDEKKYLSDIKKDFNLIQKYSHLYIKMTYRILHTLIIKTSYKKVTIDSKNFFNFDIELQTKIIEIIYGFFTSKNRHLRYKNILDSLKLLSNKKVINTNLAGMMIKRDSFFLSFTK